MLKLLSKIHICLIGILWGADFLCRHTAKLCDKGNFCAPYRSAPPAGYSCLRQRDPSDVAPLPRRQPTRAARRESRGPCPRSAVLRTARLPPLPCGVPSICHHSASNGLRPANRHHKKRSARQTCRALKINYSIPKYLAALR